MKSTVAFYTLVLILLSCKIDTHNQQPATTDRYLEEAKAFLAYFVTSNHVPGEARMPLADKPDTAELSSCFPFRVESSLEFTAAETKAIRSTITIPPIEKWNTDFFQGASFVSTDTITAVFKDRKKGWEYFYNRYGNGFISYSAPVFLKDYTVCIFYAGISCGSLCGDGRTMRFEKKGNKWEFVKEFCQWIS